MEQNAFNLLSAVIAIISLLITMIGLYAVYLQIQKLRESVWSNTHSKLCDQSFELLKFFSENPNTYAYFYERKVLEENAPDRIFILYASEALANFLEHLILQKENLPLKQWQVWERFIYTTFRASAVIGVFIRSNSEWYSKELLMIAEECELRYG